MTWSEAGYPSEQTDNPQNKVEGQSDKVYNTTDFLSKFEGNQNSIVSSCMQEIQSDAQLKEGFDNLLKSGISNDLINKIKQELKDNAELDEETLKILVQSIIAESITDFKIGLTGTIEGSTTQKVQNEAEAVQNEAEAVQNEEINNQNYEIIDVNNKIITSVKARQDLLENHPDQKKASEIDKKTREKAELAKQQLPEDTKNKLIEKGYDEDFIDNYLLVKVTLNEVKNDSSFTSAEIADFEQSVGDLDSSFKLSNRDVLLKSIDNACNIPDTNLSSFSPDNIAQTRTELFDKDIGNESLIQARKNNIESHAEAYAEIFPEMGTDEVIAKYGKFLEGDLKEFCQRYQNDDELKTRIENIKGNPSTDEERILLQNYQNMVSELNKIKEDTENNTKNLMEEMCLISQIKGMSMCIGQENGKDFNLNKANEIQNDNGVLTLKGHIDGVDFSVRHDTTKENSHLQTDSKLGISEDKNTFTIGVEGQYVDSPFILPNQNEIFSVISEVVKSNDIKDSDDWDSYAEKLQNGIIGKVDDVYKDAEFAHHYITNKVKGEKILDSSLSLIQGIKPDIDLTKPINQASNEKLHSLLKIINFNIENSTTEEKNKLNQCITKIQDIKNTYRNNSGNEGELSVAYPPIIEHYLKNEAWLNDGDEESKLGLVVDLLSYYNQNSKDTRANLEGSEGAPSKMIIEDLYRDLFEFQTNQSLVAATRKNEEIEKQDKQEADGILDLNNSAIWPPVGEVA